MGRKHNFRNAVNSLKRNGLGIDESEKKIEMKKDQGVGIKLRGVIDYLIGQHGFYVRRK